MGEKINILEEMLHKMVEGTLGCSGFSMVETDALGNAIQELKTLLTQQERINIWDLWAKEWENASKFFQSKDNTKTRSRLKDKWHKEFKEMLYEIEKAVTKPQQERIIEKAKTDRTLEILLLFSAFDEEHKEAMNKIRTTYREELQHLKNS